jgi:NitT/TauT family transport system substrate-binding protein
MKYSRQSIVAGLCLVLFSAFKASAEDKVALSLDWVVNGTHAGYFVAKEKGFYKDAGLDVTISRGFGSGDTVKRVANGSATFGIADSGAIIAARANDDIPVRMVAMIYDRSSLGLIYLKQSGITSPKDLEGRKLGRSASGASVNMLPGFFKANNVDRSKITEVVIDGALFLPMLMSGQVEAVTEQAINIGRFKKAAKDTGKEALAMRYADYGLTTYGNALIASASTVQDKPDLVKRFTEATLKGNAYAIDHPDEAISILRTSNPEVEAEGATDELMVLKETETTPDVAKYGVGYIDEKKLAATIETVTSALSLKRPLQVNELYVPGFLPQNPVIIGKK